MRASEESRRDSWRAYEEIEDPRLRAVLLDFYRDAGTGTKLDASATASRLARSVESLAAKQPDAGRLQRIETLSARREACSGAPFLELLGRLLKHPGSATVTPGCRPA